MFAYEEKNIEFIGQETNPVAPAEVTFVPQVEIDVKTIQRLTKLPSPLMVLLRPVLAPVWVTYNFVNDSAEGFIGKSQPIDQFLRICIGFWCNK